MNSKLLSFVATLLLCLFIQGKVLAQFCYVIQVPGNVTIVNGTLSTDTSTGPYFVGYGDTLIDNGSGANFYVDNGGYVKVNGFCYAWSHAANYATVDVTNGSVDSLFIDYQTNMIGTNNNTHIKSPMCFSLSLTSSSADSFKVHTERHCDGPLMFVGSSPSNAGMNIITEYGDGQVDTTLLQVTTNSLWSYAKINHTYAVSDTYSIKQVLYNNTNRIDSIGFSYIHLSCSEMRVNFYYDINNNCTYNQGLDIDITSPVQIEIDSNNIVLDTMSATSGITYRAYGNPSAVYNFKIITYPSGFVPSCPITGTATHAFQQGVPNIEYVGLYCVGSNNYDFGVNAISRAGSHALVSHILLNNQYCSPNNAALTMNYDPAYTSFTSVPAPTMQVLGTAVWSFSNLSVANPTGIYVLLDGAQFPTGVPVTTTYSVTPTIVDVNPSDNSIVVIDTTEGGFDPNAIYVKPEGCTPSGSTLEYTITFENLGNGVAENIYVLDTLPSQLDPKSIELLFASHSMFIETIPFGSATVVKFNFPDIMLADSTNHLGRHGSVKFNIDVKQGVPFGTDFQNRAGIYFDYNPPVQTNTAYNKICWPADVHEAAKAQKGINLYPNPATEELTIKTEQPYISYTITNSIGQVIIVKDMNGKESKVNVKGLSTGIYYLSLKGQGGTDVRKFVKL